MALSLLVCVISSFWFSAFLYFSLSLPVCLSFQSTSFLNHYSSVRFKWCRTWGSMCKYGEDILLTQWYTSFFFPRDVCVPIPLGSSLGACPRKCGWIMLAIMNEVKDINRFVILCVCPFGCDSSRSKQVPWRWMRHFHYNTALLCWWNSQVGGIPSVPLRMLRKMQVRNSGVLLGRSAPWEWRAL